MFGLAVKKCDKYFKTPLGFLQTNSSHDALILTLPYPLHCRDHITFVYSSMHSRDWTNYSRACMTVNYLFSITSNSFKISAPINGHTLKPNSWTKWKLSFKNLLHDCYVSYFTQSMHGISQITAAEIQKNQLLSIICTKNISFEPEITVHNTQNKNTSLSFCSLLNSLSMQNIH